MNNPEIAGFYYVQVEQDDEIVEIGLFNGKIWELIRKGSWHRAFEVFRWSLSDGFISRIPSEERIRLATRTEAPINHSIIARFKNPESLRLLHAAIGLATEAGEILDNLKKHFFYGKDIDKLNIKEELGDLDWYMNLACDVLHTTMEIVEVANIKKLAARYGEKFSEDAALLRNLGVELEVLKENLPEETK